jgi:hypothetical protein
MSDVFDPTALTSETRWVRALAHALVSDPGLADDLAQDTWLAALQHGARPEAARRGWGDGDRTRDIQLGKRKPRVRS